jgi:hypothetical protein
MMKMKSLSVVRTVQGLLKAHVLKTYLESHGIPAALDYESAGPAIGITIDGLGEVRVLVPSDRARRARRLLMRQRRLVRHRHRYLRGVRGASRRRPNQSTGSSDRPTGGHSR